MSLSYVGTPGTGSCNGGYQLSMIAPSGIQAGDLLLIFIAGSSQITTQPWGFDGPLTTISTKVGGALYARFATTSEQTTYSVTFSAATHAVGVMMAIRGAATMWNDPSALPAIFDSGTAGTSDAVPAITLSNSTDWLLGFFAFGKSAAPGTITLPAGFTQRVANFKSGTASTDTGMIAGDVQSIGSGSTGTKTATSSVSNFPLGFIVGVTPAVTGGGGAPAQSDMWPIGLKAELQVNGSWTDITDFVYTRDPIQIVAGATQEGDKAQPSTCTLTLDNRDGRFSPNNTSGNYYPNLIRGNQIRISVAAKSASGNIYNGFRFWGEVPDWPPQTSDPSNRDVFVQITATGPARHINVTGGQGSALERYYGSLTGSLAPIAYWPCEEDPEAGLVGTGVSAGNDMSITTGKPTFKAVSDFNGSAPIAVINYSTWDGLTGSFGSSGNDVYSIPGTYQWVASTSTVDARAWGAGGGGTKGQQNSSGGAGGTGGGGGECAEETSLAVTPGTQYSLKVGSGGAAGPYDSDAGDGEDSWFQGDSVQVYAHGGNGGGPPTIGGIAFGGSGGSGSGNTAHHSGGQGGGNASFYNYGAGGGSSGGTASNGNGGNAAFSSGPNLGGAAVTNGGKGGNGGDNGPTDGHPGGTPGGGGGGGWANANHNSLGGAGAPGQVALIYTPSAAPPANVVRCILKIPEQGGNVAKVILRWFTGGTINHVDLTYRSSGALRLQGYNSGGTLLFDTSNQSWSVDGRTIMVTMELTPSGSNVAYRFAAIDPGASNEIGSTSGTVTTASLGNVSEVTVAPDADISKTAIGHISVQYALVPLTTVSGHLNAHDTEVGVDRFLRLLDETVLSGLVQYKETSDHWGFETGTQSWVGTNGSLSQSSVSTVSWPAENSFSLLLTAAGGAGIWQASSPTGTSGLNVTVGDRVSASADVYTPAALGAVGCGLQFYTAAGATVGSLVQGTTVSTSAGGVYTVQVAAVAPATAAFFSVVVFDNETKAASTLLYIDNVRVSPQMGPQTRDELASLLKHMQTLDQGIMKEARELWGFKYKTRINMINQTPVVTLDYTKSVIVPPLQPAVDIKNVKNDVTVKRHKGSTVRVTLDSGSMSVQEPPGGAGRTRKVIKAIATADEQLLALASQILALGTASDERYPQVTVELSRAQYNGNLAPLMSAIAQVEIGDVIQITNLPFWYPSATAKQQVIGYTETIDGGEQLWTIQWNCVPDSPWEITISNIRRW